MTAQDRPFAGLNALKGLCDKPKCLRKQDHDGECWPKAEEQSK